MIPVQLLRKVCIFEGLSDSQLAEVSSLCGERIQDGNTLVFRQGDPAEEFYILREGRIALELGMRLWPNQKIRQMTIETLTPGEPFGVSALTTSAVRTMSARALDRSRLIVLDAGDLQKLMAEDRDIGYGVARGLSDLLISRLKDTRVKLSEFLGESQVAQERTPEESTAIRRIKYGINFRWIAVIGIFAMTLLANLVFGIRFPTAPVFMIAGGIALYNVFFSRYTRRLESEEPASVITKVRRYVWVQSAADLVASTAIIHFTGGVENPFILYYVFHVILASIILPYRVAYLLATLAEGFLTADLYLRPPFVLAVLFGFGTTLFIATYLTTAIAGELRKRQRETVALRDRLLFEADELQKANEELVRLDRLKTYFLAMASHDLKTPLAAVQSYLQVMLGGFVGELSDEHRRILGRSSERIAELFDLINGFLDLAQIEKGKVVEEMRTVSLTELLGCCVDDIRALAANKSQALIADIPADLPAIHASPEHLKQVVMNLLSNGVKFTPDGGSITLSAQELPEHIEVAVMDTGVGIAQEDLTHLFDEFYRGKGSTQTPGSGLGLHIAQRIVEAHQGKIWAESPYGNGQAGSKFVFTLPKVQPR
jgi:signal transduction histidine kinase/CRP-like cAMP-binding protein